MQQTNIPQKELVKQVLEKSLNNSNFFYQQNRQTLDCIIIALESVAQLQKDDESKRILNMRIKQAQRVVKKKQQLVQEKIARFNLIHEIKKASSVTTSTQKIIMAIAVLLTGLLAYFQSNEREGWWTNTVKVCILFLIVLFIGMMVYNCYSHRSTQKQVQDIVNQENALREET